MSALGTLIRIALRNLVQARTRTALLSTAIGIVTALLVVMLSIAGGIEDNLIRSATTLSAGHVSVAGFFKAKPGDSAPVVTDAAAIRAILEQETPGLDYIVDRERGWAKLISPTASVQAGLSGIDVAEEGRLLEQLQLAPEREYVEGGGDATPGDFGRLSERGAMVLFSSQAKRLGLRVGDTLTVQTETRGGQTNTLDAVVVAVARDVGLLSSFAVFARADDLRELYQLNADTTGAFWVYLKDIDDSEAVMDRLREVLTAHGYRVMDHVAAPFFMKFDTVAGEDWVGQKLDLTTWRDEVSFLTWILTGFDTLTWMLSLVLVAIIAVGIMNALYNAVRDRTREIGTLRAIGMTRRQVLAMFLLEALFLGLFATTVGALVGSAVVLAVDSLQWRVPIDAVRFVLLSDKLHLVVRPAAVISAVGALTLLTAVAAVWPSLRAARLRPVTAMQHTGEFGAHAPAVTSARRGPGAPSCTLSSWSRPFRCTSWWVTPPPVILDLVTGVLTAALAAGIDTVHPVQIRLGTGARVALGPSTGMPPHPVTSAPELEHRGPTEATLVYAAAAVGVLAARPETRGPPPDRDGHILWVHEVEAGLRARWATHPSGDRVAMILAGCLTWDRAQRPGARRLLEDVRALQLPPDEGLVRFTGAAPPCIPGELPDRTPLPAPPLQLDMTPTSSRSMSARPLGLSNRTPLSATPMAMPPPVSAPALEQIAEQVMMSRPAAVRPAPRPWWTRASVVAGLGLALLAGMAAGVAVPMVLLGERGAEDTPMPAPERVPPRIPTVVAPAVEAPDAAPPVVEAAAEEVVEAPAAEPAAVVEPPVVVEAPAVEAPVVEPVAAPAPAPVAVAEVPEVPPAVVAPAEAAAEVPAEAVPVPTAAEPAAEEEPAVADDGAPEILMERIPNGRGFGPPD
ncbi:MAG: FtsX-like permease family protein [Myxococcota bacterium]